MDQGIMTLITVGLVLAVVAFTFWLLYTVIWRAVRRGIQEFEYARWERVEHEDEPVPDTAAPTHHRSLHLPVRHRVPHDVDQADVVPDYPPTEWF